MCQNCGPLGKVKEVIVKSTLTVVCGGMLFVAGVAFACPYMDGKKELTYLQPEQGEQSLVEHDRQVDSNLLVELKKEKQETATN
jgi:hypothetical protein